MEIKFPKLFEPGRIGTMELRNRITMPPLGTCMATETGGISRELIHYLAARARGGAALITLEVTCIDYPRGKTTYVQPRLDNEYVLVGHSSLVDAVHAYDAKIIPQLMHSGRSTTLVTTEGLEPVAPSPIPDEMYSMVMPRELTTAEVEELVQKFVAAAMRAKNVGYDGVEIHGAHGYLVLQFMSPRMNQRQDKYGGDLAGRMTFPLEIVRGIKAAAGADFPVLFRMSADEFFPGGITLEDSKVMARMLEEAGVDAIDVSAGVPITILMWVETMEKEEGGRAYMSEEIKKAVNIPVITVGGIRSPEVAERILAEGKADFVHLGRTLLADPDWPNKAREGRVEDINKCTSCTYCLDRIGPGMGLPIRCSINPVLGREEEWAAPKPAERRKKVVVVGGGPAGMEAARVAALRGHDVTLYEKEKELGGQVRLAAVPPGKEKWNWPIQYLSTQIKKSGVKIKLGEEATVASIEREKPEVVIVATGAVPLVPDLPGIAGPNVVTAWDVLGGKVKLSGEKVIVSGGGMVGCETAEFLAKDNEVTIVEMLDAIAADMEMLHMMGFLTRVPILNIQVRTGCIVQEVTDKGVVIADKEGKRETLEADRVVLALGAEPERRVADALEGKVPELYVIGDSTKPARIMEATYDGSRIGRLI